MASFSLLSWRWRLATLACLTFFGLLIGLSRSATFAQQPVSVSIAPARGGDVAIETDVLVVTNLTGFDGNVANYTYQWYRSADQAAGNYQPSQDNDAGTGPDRYNLNLNGANDVGHRFYLQVTDGSGNTAGSNVFAVGPSRLPQLLHPRANEEIRVNQVYFNVQNVQHDGHTPPNPDGSYTYEIQVATDNTFNNIVATNNNVAERTGNNNVTYWQSAAINGTLFWRARAKMADAPGNWSNPVPFTIANVWSADGNAWHWPLDNAAVRVSGTFAEGYYHSGYLGTRLHGGIDLSGADGCGDDVRATRSGVISAPVGSGSAITLDHQDLKSSYLHMNNRTTLPRGTYVNQGSVIGSMDTVGTSQCHLHFDVLARDNATYYNPLAYVSWNDAATPVVPHSYLRSDRLLSANATGIAGTTYIIAETRDQEGGNRLAPYRVQFSVNGTEIRNIQFNSFTNADNETDFYGYQTAARGANPPYLLFAEWNTGALADNAGPQTIRMVSHDYNGHNDNREMVIGPDMTASPTSVTIDRCRPQQKTVTLTINNRNNNIEGQNNDTYQLTLQPGGVSASLSQNSITVNNGASGTVTLRISGTTGGTVKVIAASGIVTDVKDSVSVSVNVIDGPGCDHSDDNLSAASPQNLAPVPLDEEPTRVAVLFNGFAPDASGFINALREPNTLVDTDFSPDIVADYPVLVIPSGGLYGLENSAFFRARLEEYANRGGTIIVFDQQRGDEYSVLPGGGLNGYGWSQDNSCNLSSLYIRNYDQVLSGFSDAILDSNVDGYFTDLPADTDILLWRAKNGQPAMVRYDYGAGKVIATTAYDDWGLTNWQTTSDAYILNRDLLAWAVDPALLPEYDPNDPISLPVVVSNAGTVDAAAVRLTLLAPGKDVIGETTQAVSIAANTSATLTYTGTATTPLGIWRVDYTLLDDQGAVIQARQPGERFVVKNPSPLSQPLKEVAFSVNAPTERFIAGTNGEFTFTLYNNSDITRTLQVRYGLPHHTWETGDRATYGNFSDLSRTVDVGPNSQSQFVHVFPMRTNDRLFAYLYENGAQKDQTWFQTRKATAVASATVTTDQAQYARGQNVTITGSVTNLADLAVNFELRLRVTAPDNSLLYSAETPLSLAAGITQDEVLSFTVPLSATNGTYRVQADVYQEDLLVSGAVGALTLPQSPAVFGVTLPAALPPTAADPLRVTVANPHAYLPLAGVLNGVVTDPAGITTTLPAQTYNLAAGDNVTIDYDLTGLPAQYGSYRFDFTAADQYSERAWTETRQVAIATNLAFDQASYKVRQTLGLTVTLGNSDFDLTPLLTLSIPDLGYTHVQTLPLATGQTAALTFALPLTPTLGPGYHAADLSVALADVVTDTNRFLVPPSRVTAFVPQTDFPAGAAIPIEFRNLGGVDAPVTATMNLVDQYDISVVTDTVTVTVLAGQISTVTLPIPAGAASGTYYLNVNGQNGATGAAVQQQAGIHVDGVSASLFVQTEQPAYFSTDAITTMAQILMNSGALTGEDLSLRICSDNSSNGTADTSLPEPSYESQVVPIDWIDIAAGGAVVAPSNDTYTLVDIGFPFTFYDNTYTQMYVSSNGFISFGAGYTNYANGPIPSLATPNNAIYALWDDLYPIGGDYGSVFVQQIDATRTVVQWQEVSHCCNTSSPETFQIILDGSDNSITLQYLDVTLTNSATVGVEDITGSLGVQIAYNEAGVIDDNVAFKLNPGQTVVDQVMYDATNVPLNWVDIAGDGMVVSVSNNTSTLVNIGFPFTFYGNTYSQMYVNSDGYIMFGSSYNTGSNGPIPSVSNPNNAIYALWDDLYPIGGDYGNVYVQQISPTLTVVQWERVMHCCNTGSPETFQVLLDGSDNSITLQYLDVSYTGSATVGVENANGYYGIQVVYNQDGVITDGTAIHFAPQQESIPDVNYNNTAVPLNWVDIAAEGTVVSVANDTSTLVDIGFPFEFYGNSYTQMYVNSNGYITFGSSYNYSSNGPIPSVSYPNNAIYALWDDLYPIGGDYGVVYVQQISPTLTIVQWERVAHCCDPSFPETFQVLLDGSDHSITLQYLDVSYTSSATVGVENATGYYGIQVAYNQDGIITDGTAIHFAPQEQVIEDAVYDSTPVAMDWVDIAAGGTVVAADNDTYSLVDIGFPFEFFGNTYTEMYVDSNGYITFDPPYYSNPYNEPLPNPNFPNNAIYALWDDLYPVGGDAGTIFTQQISPTRMIVQWEGVTHCCNAGTPETFQIILDGSDNTVTLQYLEVTAPDFAVVGVENNTGSLAIQHNITQTGVITNGLALQFQPVPQLVEQFNYDSADVTMNWQDISATGAIVAEGDDTYTLFNIGFPFEFYGNTYTDLYVGSNGYVSFGNGYYEYYNEPIPSPYEPNNAIYGLWTDLYPVGGDYGNVYAEQVDATHTIIQWQESAHCCGLGEPETFQIILDGSDNSITLQYLQLTLPQYATVGVENASGTVATQLADGGFGGGGGAAAPLMLTAVITDGAAYKLMPVTQTVTVTSYLLSSVPISWTDVAPPDGTHVVAMGYNNTTPVDLGFPFKFYGNTYDQMYVASNGFVSFGAGYTNSGNGTIPYTGTPNNAIYGLWDYLYPIGGTYGAIYTRQISPTVYVVQYDGVVHCCNDSQPETFQIVLDGSDDSITLQYQDVTYVNSATVGVENDTGTKATQLSYNQSGIIVDGAAFKLAPVTQYITIPSYIQSSPPLAWTEIAPPDDTNVVSVGTNTYTQVDLGFPFDFYGNSYDQMYVASNGFVSFGAGYTNSGNGAIPSTGTPNNAIYGLWDYLYPIGGAYGVIYTRQISPTMYVVQYDGVTHCCSSTQPETFQIVLDGTDNSILLQYQDVTYVNSATVGVENNTGTKATQLSYNQSGIIVDGAAFKLAPVTQYITIPSYIQSSMPITWQEIAPSDDTQVVAVSNDTYSQVNLGFPFDFYGNTYNQMYVGSNGFVSFGTGYTNYANGVIPNLSTPNNAIYGLWDDLYPIGGLYGAVYTRQISPTLYVVQWEKVTHCCSTSSPETFQILLDGADNSITLQYEDVTATSSATVGVENEIGNYGTQLVYNQAGVIVDGLAYRLTPFTQAITVPTYLTATVPITWQDVAPPAGTNVVALADNTFTQVDLGFPFELYGTPYTQMYVGSNGFVSFGNGFTHNANGALPNPNTPNNAIYGLWDDLYPIGGNYGQIYTRQISPTLYVVQWEKVTHCCSTASPETFQILLDGADNTFTLQYEDVTATNSATVGVENINGTKATQTVYNQAGVIVDGLALHYTPIIEEPPPPQICDPQQVQPLNVMLVIDRSGSMGGQPIIDAKAAAITFVDLMNLDIDQVGLASFATTASLNYPLTQDGDAVKAAINALVASGSTAIGDGLAVGQAELAANADPSVAPVMILLSDGYNNAGQDPINAANNAKAAGTHIVTIGLGSGVDTALMQAIASSPQDFYYAPSSADLPEIFASIAGGFCRQPLPYADGCGFVLWEETVPVTTTNTLDVTRLAGPLNVSGRLKLDGRVFAETGQLLDQDQYPFYLYDATTALTLDTDQDIYRPGDTIQMSGNVTNTSALVEDMVLRLYHDSDLLLSQALSLSPGQGYAYQVVLTATAPLSSTNFNLAATANGRAVFKTVTVAEPQVVAQLAAPAVAGRAPFSATLTLTNTGVVPAYVTAAIANVTNSSTFALTPGQVARLEGSLSITQDTLISAPLTGDRNDTLTTTVLFGEAATIAVTPQSVYPVGQVNVPYQLTNTGILPTAFDATFTLQNSDGADVAILVIPTDLPVGESQAGLLPFGYLPADTYTIQFAMPFDNGVVDFLVVTQREAHLDAVAGLAAAATVPVTATVSNTGLETFDGQVTLQTDFFAASAPVVGLASGGSVDLPLPVDVSAAQAGDYPAHLRLLDQAGNEVDQADVTLTVTGPDLVLTSLPTNLTLPVSTTVTMTFGVANQGAAAGQGTMSFVFSDYVDEVQQFWLAGDQEGTVNFTFFVPPDIEAKVYPAPYTFNDEPGVLLLTVEGIDIGVTPSLDKVGYYEGETAQLTLHVSELADRATIPLYALVRFNDYSERQSFALPALGSTNLTFSVPVSFLGDEKVFYGIYAEASDASIHLNTIYLPQLYPDVSIFTDKQVYEPGETVMATVVTTATGQLDVTAPGFAGIIPLPGHDTTFTFTLPLEIVRGTYSIDSIPQDCNCLHENETLRTPFDVAAAEVRVVDASLDTPTCEDGAANRLHLTIASDEAVTGLLRVWLEQPDGTKSQLAEETISLEAQPANMITVPFTPVSDQSGVHRISYELLHLAADDLYYAVGAEACDAGQAILVGVVTDKAVYDAGESVLATVTLYALQPGAGELTLSVDGAFAAAQTVDLAGGFQTVTFDLGSGFAAGDHDVQALLAQAGLRSAATTDFVYGVNLPDLVMSPPFVLSSGTLERTAELFVVNAGISAAPATTIDLYLGDPDNGGQLVGTATVPTLAAGQSHTARLTYSVAGVTDPTYTLYDRVDPTNAIPERREDNNQAQTESRMPPTVEAGPDQTIHESETVSLSGAFYTGPDPLDSYSATLFWEYQDEVITPTMPTVVISGTQALMYGSYTYASDNPYPVVVAVCDPTGVCAQDSFLVTVLNLPPVVEAGPNQTADAGDNVGLAPATFTDAGIYDVHAATIDWGDGTVEAGEVNDLDGVGSGSVGGTHIYISGATYTVTVSVCDESGDCGSDFFLVAITGNIGNSDPVAVDDTATTTESVPVNVAVLDNDSDEDGDELMVIDVTTPAHGIATINPDKTIRYTPDADFVGSDSFDYTISDGQGGFATATVTVTVTNVPPTVDVGPDVIIFEGQWLQVTGSFTDPGQNQWTATVDYGLGDGEEPLPLDEDKHFDLARQYLSLGTYTVTVTVADNHGGVGSDSLQVTVLHGFAQFCVYAGIEHGVHVYEDTVIDCNVGSAEKVEIKQRAVINGYIFSFNDKVDLAQDTEVNGDITAAGKVTLHDRGVVNGSVRSGDDIDLKKDSLITGDATASEEVKLANGAAVHGVITEDAPPPVMPPLTLVQVVVNAGTTDITIPKNATQTLPPGAYHKLKVEEGATLIFLDGQYAFETIEVAKHVTLHFDLSGGSHTIVVDVEKDIDLQEYTEMTTSGQASDILFRIPEGHVHLHQNSVYLGTFLALDGHIELHEDSLLTGALFGDEVDIKQRTHVIGAPALDLLIEWFLP